MTPAKLAEAAMIAQAVTAARHFVSDKSSVVPSAYDRVIAALADERDAMAAENGRLTTELSACREAFNLETAMRTNATDENVRLTAELAEAGAARDHFRDELAEAKAENGRLRDTNARLVALLRSGPGVGDMCDASGNEECQWRVPELEPIADCWGCRRRALLAEIKAGA